jgi:hypothetical protein
VGVLGLDAHADKDKIVSITGEAAVRWISVNA